jgi:catechol 2,3-dioxygenase-like lactoylglutathione lyase family enzyme
VLAHVSLQCDDLAASAAFYDAVLATLGGGRIMEHDDAIGYGRDGSPTFWISRAADPGPGRQVHVAFVASSPADVDAFHVAAVARGDEVLHGPRLWPEYYAGYYATFVRDPGGNNVEAVHYG